MDQNRQLYKDEALELLSELESTMLELEEEPGDAELVGRAFRAMHTIKGSGAMFGFDDIAAFTHDLETVFDCIREGKLSVTKRLIDLTLSSCDVIKQMLDGKKTDKLRAEELVKFFKEMLCEVKTQDKTPLPACDEPLCNLNPEATYRVRFNPNQDIFTSGTNPILLMDELRSLGKCSIVALPVNIPKLRDLNPEACYVRWDAILTTDKGINSIKDVFIFVDDNCELSIDIIDEEGVMGDEIDYKKLGEILLDRGDISSEELIKALKSQKRIGQILVEEKTVEHDFVESALAEQYHIKQIRKRRQETDAASTVRVPAEKLDTLVDLVGELVTVQARLSQKSSQQDDADFIAIAEEVERLTAELRDNTMGIRMLPINTTFARFRRLLRDLSNDLGKEVALITEGGETELDKTIIERLNDPLVHLIRNSIDHGIETPDERQGLGKKRTGTVRLTAAHRDASVVITIEDDGAGLDPDAIRAKAVERGLVVSDAELSENEIFSLIFAPGFSTAKRVTDISGRGVGMDVVKKSIEALRGSIEINSRRNIGTTIILKLPLTLAIIDGLLVELDKAFYVLPLSAVEECAELSREDVSEARGRNIANVRGEIVPYIPLRELFGIINDPPDIEHLVITEVEGNRFGVVVDQVIGEHQTVIKSLGKAYKNAKGLSGATILADGTVALILDVHKLTEIAESEELMTINKRMR